MALVGALVWIGRAFLAGAGTGLLALVAFILGALAFFATCLFLLWLVSPRH